MDKLVTLELTRTDSWHRTLLGLFNVPLKYICKKRQIDFNIQLTNKGVKWVKANICKEYDGIHYCFMIVNKKNINLPPTSLKDLEKIIDLLKQSIDCRIKGSDLVIL